MSIRIFITGGTFDKEYNELNGSLFFRDTHIHNVLNLGRSQVDANVQTLMMVDSLDMTTEEREIIAHNCVYEESDKIIITHGTDTMVETAKVIAQHVKDKTVILTGAMIPYQFGSSDGLFNLGASIAFVQSLPHGVYIAMNGQYFNYKNVRKNKKLGRFETIE